MADNTNDQPVVDDQSNKPDIDAILGTKLAELEAKVEEKYKSQINGLNRKVTELEKEKQAVEESKLSESEKLAKQMEAVLNEVAEWKIEAKAEKQARQELETFTKKGLDPMWLEALHKDSVEERAEAIASLLEATKGQGIDKVKQDLAFKPKTGDDTPPEYDVEELAKDPIKMTELKRTNHDLYKILLPKVSAKLRG